MSAVITGGVNVLATCVSIYGVDKWGRRKLFLEGGTQMLICQVAVAIFIGIKFGVNGDPGDLPKWYAVVVVQFICSYVAGFAWSWGPLGWLVRSEIFPLEIRSAAQIRTFPILCLLGHLTAFVYLFLPETKNIPIEEMVIVWKKHWFWSRFMVDVDYPNGVELIKDGDIVKKV
ncbi:hypothetical protein L1987_58771 [Smallanthus sonchifolius]|uniref:Uncharacterized protein n=1 Tax=Smallanthus sonchifolius TaxID=185202 RepID=A0ACB9D3G0_9ASTR|nr:hypothetical protein L1987_58771 [Smallanthus sonchifolius]